jgi:hypothetical protein
MMKKTISTNALKESLVGKGYIVIFGNGNMSIGRCENLDLGFDSVKVFLDSTQDADVLDFDEADKRWKNLIFNNEDKKRPIYRVTNSEIDSWMELMIKD